MGTIWAGLVRVSFMGERKAGSDSFHADREQVESVKRYAAAHGAQVEFMEPELSVSGGKSIDQRPYLKAAIEGVEAGIYDGIVVAYLSRLTRSRSGLEIWDRVEAAGGHVHCAAENLDTSTPNGRFIRDVHLANAVREREEHVDRFDERRRHATSVGIWQRRQTPRGYRRDPSSRRLVPDEQAVAVRDAFRRRGAGESISSLADDLGMTQSGVRYLLRNRVYLGELRVGEYVNTHAHDPLVTIAEFEAAQHEVPRPGRNLSREPALLAGLVRCASCGHRMSRSSAARVVYVCHGRSSAGPCPAPTAVTADLLDAHVEQIARAELQRLTIEGTDAHRPIDEAQQRVADAERELEAYLEAVSAADIGVEAFAVGARQRRLAIDEAHADLRERLATQMIAPGFGSGEEVWEALEQHEKNSVLRGLLRVVIVRRAGGRGARTKLADRVRVLAHDADFPLPERRGGEAIGIISLPFPDADHPGVLRVPD